MNEIEQSIEQSAGLNFIYLVGNRYGYLYVPLEIDKDEFETIMDVAEEEGIPNLELVEKWFLLDENRSPSKYLYVVNISIGILHRKLLISCVLANYNLLQKLSRRRQTRMGARRKVDNQSITRCC